MSDMINVTSIRELLHKSYQKETSGVIHESESEYELICVDYGRLTLELKHTSLWLKSSQMILIPPRQMHCLRNAEKGAMHFFNIMFSGTVPGSLCSRVFDVDQEGYRLLMEMREETLRKELSYDLICRNDLTHFLIRLQRRNNSQDPAAPVRSNRPSRFRSERARVIYEKVCNEYRNIRFDELAAVSGVSRSELYLIFRNEIGSSFRAIVSGCKLEQAQYLLQRGDLSLAEIASDIGCELPSLFRLFKQLTGMTPGEYARSLGTPSVQGPDLSPEKY